MSCVPCTDINALVATVDNLIYKMLAAGQLQPGLLDCDGNRLTQDNQLVLCSKLLSMVQEAIDSGAIQLPLDVHAEAVSFVDDYIIVRLNDGTEIKSETKIPEQVKPTEMTVDQENHIILTLSDGTQLRTETPVETPPPVEVTGIMVDQENHLVITLSDGTTLRTDTAVETPEPVKITSVVVDGDNHIVITLSDGEVLRSATAVETPEPIRVTAITVNQQGYVALTMSDGSEVIAVDPLPQIEVSLVAVDTSNRITVGLSNGSHFTSEPMTIGEVTGVAVDADNYILVTAKRASDSEQVTYRSETPVQTPAATTVTGISIGNDGYITITLSDGTIIKSDTDVNAACMFVSCDGDPIDTCTPIATCEQLRNVVPMDGLEGQVLAYGEGGMNYWTDQYELSNCAGEALPHKAQVPSCEEFNDAIARLKPTAGDGVIIDEATNTVSVDTEWLRKQIASALCGSYTSCATWNYTVSRSAVPVLDSGSLYYVEVSAGEKVETSWFQSSVEGSACFDYDVIINETGSTFVLRNGGVMEQTLSVEGTTNQYVKVQKLELSEEHELASVTSYSTPVSRTENISNVQVGSATVTPTYRIYPNGGEITDTRASATRWFYTLNLTNTLPAGTYDILVQADDSLNLNLNGASYDTGLLSEYSSQSRYTIFQLTTTGVTHTIYADNYNRDLPGEHNPSWFTLVIVDSAGNIVFNSVDEGDNVWYVSQTDLSCDAVVINVNT